MNIAMLYQAGMGMDDRDYYLLDDDATKAVRESYKQSSTSSSRWPVPTRRKLPRP